MSGIESTSHLGGVAVGAGHIEAGTVKPLAVSSAKRLAALPNVPTLAESNVADFGASNWWLLAAPKGTPAAVIERLGKADPPLAEAPARATEGLAALGEALVALRAALDAVVAASDPPRG